MQQRFKNLELCQAIGNDSKRTRAQVYNCLCLQRKRMNSNRSRDIIKDEVLEIKPNFSPGDVLSAYDELEARDC